MLKRFFRRSFNLVLAALMLAGTQPVYFPAATAAVAPSPTTINSLSLTTIDNISAGMGHSLTIDAAGNLYAWGLNNFGQLGTGDFIDRTAPVRIKPDTQFSSVAAGQYHSLAIDTKGQLWVWGLNNFGQLGTGGNKNEPLPKPVKQETLFQTVAAGGEHSLAIDTDKNLWAWGHNGDGRLGVAGGDRNTPEQVMKGTIFSAVAAGRYHTLAIDASGKLYAWGRNNDGQCTIPAAVPNNPPNATSFTVGPFTVNRVSKVIKVAAGDHHSLALVEHTDVYTYTTPLIISGAPNRSLTVAFTVRSRDLWTWGRNNDGQRGGDIPATVTANVTHNIPASPTPVPSPLQAVITVTVTDIEDISAGANHSLAIQKTNQISRTVPITGLDPTFSVNAGDITDYSMTTPVYNLRSCGRNSSGQIGGNPYADGTAWAPTVPPVNATRVAAGGNHSLAISTAGNLLAWGANYFGQLGVGYPENDKVEAGGSHSLKVETTGQLLSWGCNNFGQLGNGSTVTGLTEQPIPGLNGVVSAAAGLYHSLALDANGALWAWGRNDSGQLGVSFASLPPNVPADYLTTPVIVAFPAGTAVITKIAAGGNHSLAIDKDGQLWAWGRNDYGQLGDNNSLNANRRVPVRVDSKKAWGNKKVVSVAAGRNHSLAIDEDGDLWAWGRNDYGQLGDDKAPKYSKIPVKVDAQWGKKKITDIAAGQYHSLAIDTDGQGWSWGSNRSGQLGDNAVQTANGSFPGQRNSPAAIAPSITDDALFVAAGDNHSMAIDTDMKLWDWGFNSSGQLGDVPDARRNRSTPSRAQDVPVSPITPVIHVSGGANHTLAIIANNTMYAWGANYCGQLGANHPQDIDRPKPVLMIEDLVSVAAGGNHSLAADKSGRVWTWGENYNGQLGDDTFSCRSVPRSLSDIKNVTEVTAGGNHSLAIDSKHNLWGWGYNLYGQLQTPSKIGKVSPLMIVAKNSKSAAAGSNFTLSIGSKDGKLYARGGNENGQLSAGKMYSTSPYKLSFPKTQAKKLVAIEGEGQRADMIAAGEYHTMSVTGGQLRTWGYNYYGQLGFPPNIIANQPGEIAYKVEPTLISLPAVKSVSAGYMHSLAIDTAGDLWAWGWNKYGQLGNGATDDTHNPPAVAISRVMNNVDKIAAGAAHTLALDTAGILWAWGLNADGQLGDGSTTNKSNTPMNFSLTQPILYSVDKIAAGGGHSLAIDINGNVWAWGRDNHGQLGLAAPVTCKCAAKDNGIIYNEFMVQGFYQSGTIADGFFIDLNREILIAPWFDTKEYSVDGGGKWKQITDKDELRQAKFPKLLDNKKGLTLHIKDSTGTIITFATINKRAAKPKPALSVNYKIYEDPTGDTPGGWTLANKNGVEADKSVVQIGAANAKKNGIDTLGFGVFKLTGGIPVNELPLDEKVLKTTYFYRTAPTDNGNGTYTAGSKPTKITVTSEQKKPAYKPDKNNEIKLKAGTYVKLPNDTVPTLYTIKSTVSVESGMEIWTAATAKKAASAKQTSI